MSNNESELPQNLLDALQTFAHTAWHNSSAFRRSHHTNSSHDLEYLHLQDHAVALRYLFGSSVARYSKILVRDEYREALRALRTDSVYEQGMFIIGQPGIGKTSFLVYVLLEQLHEHRPVAIQLRASDPFYAFFTHTCTLYSLSNPAPLVQEDVWALSDLRVSTSIPLDVFLDVSAKVIQAAPPNVKYWEKWSQSRGAEMFIMDIWSEEEITDLSRLLELDVEHMVALTAKWGGVPRTLIQQCMNTESQQDWELRRASTRIVENYMSLLPALHTLDAQDICPSPAIFFVLPLKDRAGNIYRRRYTIRVPTKAIENALAVALQQIQSKARIDFFQFMSIHPGTRSCVKSIFINWFYSLFTSGRPFHCNWHNRDSYSTSALGTIKAGQLPVIHDATMSMNPPYYWIAPIGEFPGIDCALVTESRIFVIQATTSFQPLSSPPQIGLDKLRNLLPVTWQKNSKVPWYFMFVGISEELVHNAFKHWQHKLTNVSVGWCAVDPADVGIPDKAYTQDDGLEVIGE